jgi:hypothetical protein
LKRHQLQLLEPFDIVPVKRGVDFFEIRLGYFVLPLGVRLAFRWIERRCPREFINRTRRPIRICFPETKLGQAQIPRALNAIGINLDGLSSSFVRGSTVVAIPRCRAAGDLDIEQRIRASRLGQGRAGSRGVLSSV